MDERRGLWHLLVRDGIPLITLSGLLLIGAGLFVSFQAGTGHFLPHDEAYLGMKATDLCAMQQCRIVHFMIHDRIAFGGSLVAVGALYLYLAAVPMTQRLPWAWWTLLASGVVGFASFLSYLGPGYLDAWHGAATLVLLPIFVAGLALTCPKRTSRQAPADQAPAGVPWPRRSPAGIGWRLLLFTSFSIMMGGIIILFVGATRVFVPEDLGYLGLSTAELRAINPRLIPLIAHDRAGFGGGVLCCGLTLLLCIRYARPSRALWQTLFIAGAAGFGSALVVHFPIGYTTLTHLAPAYLGIAMCAVGLALTRPAMVR